MFYSVQLVFIGISLFGKASLAADEFWMESPRVANWGTWGNVERCPAGQFATGFRLKVEAGQGSGDDTSLNGIQLFCNTAGRVSESNLISSKVAQLGEWKNKFRCTEGMLIGFQLRTEPGSSDNDDTAANNIRMLCSNAELGKMEGDGNGWGDWTTEQRCGKRQAICAIRTQVEDYQGNGDDTSLNNVDMLCCNIPSPASTCKPTDAWYEVISCTNTGVTESLRCQYAYKTGVGSESTTSDTTTEERSATQSVGFSIGVEIGYLKSNFETSFSVSQTTGHSWGSTSTNSWTEEKQVTADFEVPAGRKRVLSQVVGNCGGLEAFTVDFKMDEFDLRGNQLTSKPVSQADLSNRLN